MGADVNAVVERVVETSQPVPPETEVVTTAAVYDYPVVDPETGDESVVTLSEKEHLQVQFAPDPTAAFDLVVEARDADHSEPAPVDEPPQDEQPPASELPSVDPAAPQDFGPPPEVPGWDQAPPPADEHPAPEAPATGDPTPVETENEPPSPPASEQTDADGPAPDLQV